MTPAAADTPGIAAFIEARCEADDVVAFHMEDRRHKALTAMRRAILALHQPADWRGGFCNTCASVPFYPCQTVRLLAAIDADHPDYDPEWKPQAEAPAAGEAYYNSLYGGQDPSDGDTI